MAEQPETITVSGRPTVGSDEERTVIEVEADSGLEALVPLDAPFEAPLEDVLEQRRVEPLDEDAYQGS